MSLRWTAAFLTLLLMAPVARAEEPVVLTIAWTSVPGQLTPVLYQNKSILKHYGKSYIVQPIKVRGSGPQITAMAAGELNMGALAPNTFVLAIQNAKMDDLRIIGDVTRDGNGDYFSSEYVVRADSPIKTLEDMKGKVAGSSSIGGATDTGFRKLLFDHGMADKRDLQIVEIEFSNMLPALLEKRIDMGAMTVPWAYFAKKNNQIRVIARMKDGMGPQEQNFWVARTPFIAAHRAALVDYFEDTQNAMRWFLDPKNRPQVVKILADFTKDSASDFDQWVFTTEDDYHAADARPDLDMLQRNIDTVKQMGILKLSVDVKKYSDLSMVDEALARPR